MKSLREGVLNMKKYRLLWLAALIIALCVGCGRAETAQSDTVLATTYPVYYLTSSILSGEAGTVPGVTVEEMISESVSCLHDYTLTTTQMKLVDRADLVICSGAGLEDFMESALSGVPAENLVDSSQGIELIDDDPHIWLDPERFAQQGENIAQALAERYPDQAEIIQANAAALTETLRGLKTQWAERFQALSSREIITFHDGFTYLADAFDLTILAAIEEEEGAEASASELKEVCNLVETHKISTVFGEVNGSTNALEIVCRETGARSDTLSMLMSGDLADQADGYLTGLTENLEKLEAALQ
jgi:zinc transport system substrate-binding protein